MTRAPDDKAFRGRMQQLQTLLAELESFTDSTARAKMSRMVQSLMDFHGEGISRIVAQLQNDGATGQSTLERLAKDELVSSLFLLYGLHPLDLQTRVKSALDKVRPYLHSHGGNVELLGISPQGVVRLRMQGSCHGCPSSAATLQNSIEQAILETAPDVTEIAVEGVVPAAPVSPGFVPVERLTSHPGKSRAGHSQGVNHDDLFQTPA